jgi:hypothetical protein
MGYCCVYVVREFHDMTEHDGCCWRRDAERNEEGSACAIVLDLGFSQRVEVGDDLRPGP